MTSISGVGVEALASNVSGYQSQIADLQRQCADWRACATTSPAEKQTLISALQSQIQTLQHKIEKVEPVPPASAAYDVADKISQPQIPTADGVNRPDKDAFAIAGSVINLSI